MISAKTFDARTDIAITAIGKDLVAFMPTPERRVSVAYYDASVGFFRAPVRAAVRYPVGESET